MALRLCEVEPRNYTFVCTPTGSESPEMFEHWKRLGEMLSSPIKPIVAGTLRGLIREQKALPNWRQRWCTRMLKIEPYAKFLSSLGECISYVGIRFDEPERESGDYTDIAGVTMDFPLRRWQWTIRDVRGYLAKRGIEIPTRTDCLECFFQQIGEWYDFWNLHPEEWNEAEQLEYFTGHTFRGPNRDTWPTSMRELRQEFEKGRIPKHASSDSLFQLKCRVCKL